MSGAESTVSQQTIQKVLGLQPSADLGDIVAAFFDTLKEELNRPKETPTEEQYTQTEAYLRATYGLFFDFSMKWASGTRQRYKDTKNHPQAQELKKKAAAVLGNLQDNMVKYAINYMHLGYSEGCILAEIAKYPRRADIESFEWTSDSGYMLQKNFAERRQLLEVNQKLAKGIEILQVNEQYYKAVINNATKLFGEKSVEDYIRPFRSGLRMGDFAKARKALAAMDNAKTKMGVGKSDLKKAIQTSGKAFIDVMEKEQESLMGPEEKMFLNVSELSVIIGSNEQEILQKEKYIRKYQHPFMEGKITKLRYFYEKMLIAGSVDSLLTLYMRLIRGLAQPLTDTKDVRAYEEEVLQNVTYLMEGQFQEIDKIEQRRIEEMDDFYSTLKEFDAVL